MFDNPKPQKNKTSKRTSTPSTILLSPPFASQPSTTQPAVVSPPSSAPSPFLLTPSAPYPVYPAPSPAPSPVFVSPASPTLSHHQTSAHPIPSSSSISNSSTPSSSSSLSSNPSIETPLPLNSRYNYSSNSTNDYSSAYLFNIPPSSSMPFISSSSSSTTSTSAIPTSSSHPYPSSSSSTTTSTTSTSSSSPPSLSSDISTPSSSTSTSSSTSSSTIRLNIGGYRYVTTRDTLVQVGKSHFFAVLLSGAMTPTLDDDGAYFVDRNGRYFEPLLDYLRTGILDVPPSMSRAHVLEQALFFGIDVSPFARDLVADISQRQLTLVVNGIGAGKLQLPGYDLRGRSFAYLDLTNAILTGAVLRGADFREATLTRCDLRGADLERCNFGRANLKGAKIKGANLTRADLAHAYLQGADLREANLQNANLQSADLQNANLSGALLDNVHVKGARFRGCEGISGISLMCAQCGNMYQPATSHNRRGVCPATLGSHFPAEVQPFESDDHLQQPASPPPEPRAGKKSFLSSLFTSLHGSPSSASVAVPAAPSNPQAEGAQQSSSPPSSAEPILYQAAAFSDAFARPPSPPNGHEFNLN